MKKIKILTVSFENSISPPEVPYFRGAIIQTSGLENELFHNHNDKGYRYAYPLIQYKRKNGKPLMPCLDSGVESSFHFFSNHQEGIMLGNRKYNLVVDELNITTASLDVTKGAFKYTVNDWLPLNQKNYKVYFSLKSEIEQLEFLENIMTGNILSFAKGIDWRITSQVKVRINKIKNIKKITFKQNPRMAFSISFSCNIKLPNYIGIGKNASLGYGVVEAINN
jgi:hypothetical protein